MDQMGSARVSIVIPTYNRWPKVCDAIDSVLAQTLPTIPVVVDDCSTDGSADALAETYGDDIQLIRQATNQEKSAARNRGIDEATTEFLCFLDSDDTFAKDGVENLLRIYDATPEFNGVSYGGCTVGGEIEFPLDTLPSGTVLAEYLKKPFLHTLSFMIRKSRLTEIGPYRATLYNMEDIELFIRLMARMDFIPCGAVVADIEKQDDSASVNFDKMADQGTEVLAYLKSDQTAMDAMGDGFRQVQRKVYHELSRALYKSGRYKDYCELYKTMRSELPDEFGGGRYRQRYWVAKIKGIFC